MKIDNHILYGNDNKPVKYIATPNRGGIIVPKYLIMHYDAASNNTAAINWMVSPTSKVSAHLHIDREGKVVQLAPLNIKCWHAGESKWKDIVGLNSHSIGIELQNTGKQEYTDIQIKVAEEVAATIVRYYGIKEILGHSDIAPGRKVDPGPMFPMEDFRQAAGLAPSGNVQVLKTISDLNLRQGPSTTDKVISVLPKSTEVNVIDANGDWSKVFVCASKLQGWVSKKYLA